MNGYYYLHGAVFRVVDSACFGTLLFRRETGGGVFCQDIRSSNKLKKFQEVKIDTVPFDLSETHLKKRVGNEALFCFKITNDVILVETFKKMTNILRVFLENNSVSAFLGLEIADFVDDAELKNRMEATAFKEIGKFDLGIAANWLELSRKKQPLRSDCVRESNISKSDSHQGQHYKSSLEKQQKIGPSAFSQEWTPERVAALIALWNEDLTTSEIGRRLGVTKNAVIGKVHNLGLPKRRPSPHPEGEISDVVRLDQLRPGLCSWPLGDPEKVGFHFCGDKAVEGKPYCAAHCAMAYNTAVERNRDSA